MATLLNELVRDRVNASVGMTLSRATERMAEKLASEWTMSPALKERLRVLVETQFEATVKDLLREPGRKRAKVRKRNRQ